MKFFQKNELKILWPFYLESIISPMLFFAPVFMVVYFVGINLTLFQIGILIGVSPLAALLLEIPTGAVADLYGRKVSVLIGYFLGGLSFILLFFVRDFYSLIFVFVLLGIGSTFSSGSKEAWIVDSINKKNKKLLHHFFNKSMAFNSFGLIVSGLIGALLVKKFGVSIIWPVAFMSYLISFSILLFAKEEYVKRKVQVKESFSGVYKQTKKAISYGYKHHVMFYYLLATFLFAFAAGFISPITWVPFLQELDFPDYGFGYMWSLMAFFMMIAPVFSRKFLKEGKEKSFMMICIGISVLIMLLILIPKSWIFALTILIAVEFFIQLRTPASRMYFHRFTPSKIRATMGSVKAMLIAIAAIIISPLVGYLVDKIGARTTILFYAPIMIVVVLIYLLIKEERIE